MIKNNYRYSLSFRQQTIYEDIDSVILNALSHGGKRVFNPRADFNDLPKAVELAEKYNEVYFASWNSSLMI